jgi:hypothetical protein
MTRSRREASADRCGLPPWLFGAPPGGEERRPLARLFRARSQSLAPGYPSRLVRRQKLGEERPQGVGRDPVAKLVRMLIEG